MIQDVIEADPMKFMAFVACVLLVTTVLMGIVLLVGGWIATRLYNIIMDAIEKTLK